MPSTVQLYDRTSPSGSLLPVPSSVREAVSFAGLPECTAVAVRLPPALAIGARFLVNANVNDNPVAISQTPLRPDGTSVTPSLPLFPQATTVPFGFNAALWPPPAETAETPESPAGISSWPYALL